MYVYNVVHWCINEVYLIKWMHKFADLF